MDPLPERASEWVGVGSIVLGAVVLTGYALHNPYLVALHPGAHAAMMANTAVSFVFAGLALLGLRLLGALPLIALNGAQLIENLAGPSLGVDWPRLHAWLNQAQVHPGRASPIACAGFLLFAATVLVLPHIRTRRAAYLARSLTGLVVFAGAAGIVGYILRFDMLFEVRGMTRTAVHTSVGLVALGVGLWLSWRPAPWNSPRRLATHGGNILAAAAAALVIVVAAAGVSGFWLLERMAERDAEVQLNLRRQERVVYVRALLQQGVRRGEIMAQRIGAIGGTLSVTLERDFSSIVQRDAQGQVIGRFGRPLRAPAVSVAIPSGAQTALLWDNGYYYLRQVLPITRKAPGTVELEQPLPLLATVGVASPTWGESGEISICGGALQPQQMACFPVRLHPQPYFLNRSIFGVTLPMSRALNGETGFIEAIDYRGQRALASYAPIPGTGLGLVAKIDAAELYAPIRRQFEIMVPLLALLTVGGLEILRWQVRPLVRELVDSRSRAMVSEARFRAAAESGLDPFFIFECEREPLRSRILDFRLVYANKVGERLAELDFRPPGRIGLAQLRALSEPGGFLAKFSRVVATRRPLEMDFPLTAAGAPADSREETGLHWLHLQAAPLGDGVAVTLHDISNRKWEEERLIAVAETDPLTRLLNRTAFRKRLEHAIESSRRLRYQSLLALLYLDIDHFKEINDALGHVQGDRLLEVFAERLRGCVRSVDSVGRPGGDEFTILLENLDCPEDAERVVLAIYTSLGRPVRLDSHEMGIGASTGMAFYSGEDISAEELIRRADAAMYEAKRDGRNRYRVFAE